MYLGALKTFTGGTKTTSSNSSVSASPGVTGVSGGLIGPFRERDGCPKGSVVAHRYGGDSFQNPYPMVQCRVIQTSPTPVTQPSSGQQSINFTPTITVSPNVQTQVSPQISPVFQQTGQGSQSAGTSQVSPGGQSGSGGGSGEGGILLEFIKQQQEADERRRADEQQRQQAILEAQQKEAAAQRLLDEQRYYEAEQARVRAEENREAERQRLFTEQQTQLQTREQERVAELQRIQEEMAANATNFQSSGGGGGSNIDWNQTLPVTSSDDTKAPPIKSLSITDNLPILIGGVVLVGGAYYFSKFKSKKRR